MHHVIKWLMSLNSILLILSVLTLNNWIRSLSIRCLPQSERGATSLHFISVSSVSNAGLPKDHPVLKTWLIPNSLSVQNFKVWSCDDLIWCYKILFGYVDLSSDERFAPSPAVAVHAQGSLTPYKLFKKHSNIRSRQTFYNERVINVELSTVRHCLF